MPTPVTPNMNLPLGTIGTTTGLQWEQLVNAALLLLDQHNHEPGSGVLITPAALDINADLDFQDNNALNLRSSRYTPIDLSDLTGDDIGCTVVSGDGNLYYVDSDGNQIQITNNGAVAGTPGSIANLVPPASATYVPVSSKFVWQSAVDVAADMDGGAIIIREKIANANGITLQSPASLAAAYALTFPAALPASNALVMMSSAGILTAPVMPDISQATIRSLSVGGTGGVDITPFALSAATSTGAVRQKFYNAGATKHFEIDADFTADTFILQSDTATLWTFARAGGASTIYPIDLNGSSLAGSGAMSPLVLTNVSAGLAFQSASNAALTGFGTRGVGVKPSGATLMPLITSPSGTSNPLTSIIGGVLMDFSTGAVSVAAGSGFSVADSGGSGAGICNFRVTFTTNYLTGTPTVLFNADVLNGTFGGVAIDRGPGVPSASSVCFSAGGAGGQTVMYFNVTAQRGSA